MDISFYFDVYRKTFEYVFSFLTQLQLKKKKPYGKDTEEALNDYETIGSAQYLPSICLITHILLLDCISAGKLSTKFMADTVQDQTFYRFSYLRLTLMVVT